MIISIIEGDSKNKRIDEHNFCCDYLNKSLNKIIREPYGFHVCKYTIFTIFTDRSGMLYQSNQWCATWEKIHFIHLPQIFSFFFSIQIALDGHMSDKHKHCLNRK